MEQTRWPELPYDAWGGTRETFHLWLQVVGKTKLALTPFWNEWWNVGLSLTGRGLTTGPMPAGPVDLQVDVDLVDDAVRLLTSDGRSREVALRPRTVADFHAAFLAALSELEVAVEIAPLPSEVADPVRFDADEVHGSYDGDAVRRWWRAALSVGRVMERYRVPFGGKSSPVLLFWGGFDLSHTRFNGRRAPARADAGSILALGEDQENVAVGFWPGDARSPHAVLYAYLAPAPAGVETARVEPNAASWVPQLGEFVLPWEELVRSADPDATALAFFTSAYRATSALAGWDHAALELPSVPATRAG